MQSDDNLFSDFPPVSREAWEEIIKKDLHGADYKTKLNWQTGEGVEALPFYRQDNFDSLPEPVSTPGDWNIRQQVDEQDISRANEFTRQALTHGADEISFTLRVEPTGGNLGSDLHGTAIQDQAAFNKLLQGVCLSEHALHLEVPGISPVMLAMLHNHCNEKNIDLQSVRGSVLDDPFTFALTHGYFSVSEETLSERYKQIVAFCERNLPGLKCLGIDARTYHNAGATITQEIAYALATASEYMASLTKTGLDPDVIASAIHFDLSVGSNYFLEIAKFRALRKLWPAVLNAYAAKEQPAYIHATTSGWNKTAYDPYVNMLRTTTEGMSAATAGCDAITIQPFDESFRRPNDFSRRIARNSQTILKEEAYFNKVSDPAAGSYYIEKLTDKIAKAAWHGFQEIEQQGGMQESIREGYPQTAIEESRKQRDMAIATRQRVFVGINKYPNTDGAQLLKQAETPAASLKQTDTDFELDPRQLIITVKQALHNGAAIGDLLPEITQAGKMEIRTIRTYRGAQAFEELRQATKHHATTPTVLMLPVGNKRARKARSTFASNFFGCAGYEIEDPIGFDSIEKAVSIVQNQQPDVAVLCSSDEEYPELVPELCSKIEELNKKPILVLAGYPKKHIETFKNAGVDFFIHAKSNVLEMLKEFQKRLNIIKNDK